MLIESNAKKCAFLAEAIRLLQLSNATVYEGRMESLAVDSAKFDFVVSRALGQFDQFLAWARRSLTARGKALLWLGESDSAAIARPGWLWEPSKLIPGSTRRYLLVGSSNRGTGHFFKGPVFLPFNPNVPRGTISPCTPAGIPAFNLKSSTWSNFADPEFLRELPYSPEIACAP